MDETIALGVVMLLVLLVGVGIGMAAGSYVEASKRRSGGSQTEHRCTDMGGNEPAQPMWYEPRR